MKTSGNKQKEKKESTDEFKFPEEPKSKMDEAKEFLEASLDNKNAIKLSKKKKYYKEKYGR